MSNKETSRIAVIGLGCYYPGAKSPLELWENVLARRQQFREMPEVRLPSSEYFDADSSAPDKTYQNKAAVLDGYIFNWLEKRIPQRTVESTDIVHWLALDTAIKAVEDAGYSKETLPRDTTGVVIGNTLTGEFTRANTMMLRWPYVRKVLKASLEQKGLLHHFKELETSMETYYKSVFAPVTEDTLAGGLANTIAGRVCNFLDVHGGGYIVDGACSSSLIAIATAANHLETRQMDVVIAGGVDISLDTFELVGFAKTGALTHDEMRVYDKNGKGFIPGEGCGVVVLKRLDDAIRDNNQIYAIINGWGISSDGKGGITAPSSSGQALALKRAYQKADFNTEKLNFIEGHGTGTTVGDKTELEGISLALNHDKVLSERSCGVTSFKSIVGHTKAAAGVGAFIKTVISLNRRILPPTAGLKERNPIFDDRAKSLYPILHGEVRTKESILHAGVSAMGFGGINSHVLLQSADKPFSKLQPEIEERKLLASSQSSEMFFLSADSVQALMEATEAVLLESNGMSYAEMADYAFHLNSKVSFTKQFRAAIISSTPEELKTKLNIVLNTLREKVLTESVLAIESNTVLLASKKNNLKIGGLFPGQGSQKLNMANKLVERFEWARDLVEEAEKIFSKENSKGIKSFIYKNIDRVKNNNELKAWNDELKQTNIAQPAIILSSLLWHTYLEKLGIKLSAGAGHSLGELMAFYTAKLYSKETLLGFASFRGKSMAQSSSGSMASLFCPVDKVYNLINKVTGYLTVANINGPEQIVISGDTESIRDLMELATAEGINAIELPVSAAFHSKLVSGTADAIKHYTPLTQSSAPATDFKLISSVNGKVRAEKTDLKEYFANQAITQVNFVEAVHSLSQECDVLIEVGPGKVLSNLVNNIDNKIPTFPLEASPEDDLSFNLALANLFVRGSDLNISEIYTSRLIRKFIPASQKQFIVNPLERPFPDKLLETVPSSEYTENEYSNNFNLNQINLPEEVLNGYLETRGEFIKDVILSDLKHWKKESVPPQKQVISTSKTSISKVHTLQKATSQLLNIEQSKVEQKAESSSFDRITEDVFNLVVQKTGFPRQALTSELKLLNDLNLDSIKAGSLLAELFKKYSLQGKLETSTYANASLGEIASIIGELTIQKDSQASVETSNTSHTPKIEVQDIVFQLVSEKTGFPKEGLKAEFKLLDDLNLDSIKAGSLLAQLTKQFQVQSKVEASAFANASLGEIIHKINSLLLPAETTITSVPIKLEKIHNNITSNWVESFSVELVEELSNDKDINKIQSLGIIYTNNNQKLAQQLLKGFSKFSEKVEIANHKDLSHRENASFERLCVMIPKTSENIEVVTETVELLANIARFTANKNIEIGFVQFGNGEFSRGKSNKASNSIISSVAFASSLHLERPHLKIRVLEFDSHLAQNICSNKLFAEFNNPEMFEAIGFDSKGVRRKMVYELASPKATTRTTPKLNSSDVVLVTGGAKGITAECALAIGKKYNCTMALVGSSPISAEIQATLEKFKTENIKTAYFACNISSEQSVEELIPTIENNLGSKITAVIHGAGINKPRRAEQVSHEEALQEISPKLRGAYNLTKSLKENKLKYFVALTSIIGVTGMQGNSWYAFSNETLDLFLRNYKQQTGTETLTIAYSVWSEVGMGERMGSTKTLANMGINPIPPDKGIDQFLYWLENQTDDQQIVIAAKLGGLDTWKRKTYSIPSSNRYLEDVIYCEPGIELIAQATLSRHHDQYTDDHSFNGSLLFPTVFGIEAMAQAALYVSGTEDFASIILENISLQRPIVVPETDETKIQIRAEVVREDGKVKVFTGISTEDSGFSVNHFSAEISFTTNAKLQKRKLHLPTMPLSIEPETDLYSWLLFQGKTFQNIEQVYSMTSRSTCFSTKNFPTDTSELCFSEAKKTPFLLGSALVRDTLLQTAQLILYKNIYLPIGIKRWEISRTSNYSEKNFVECNLLDEQDNKASLEVYLINQHGETTETISGYEVKALKPTPNYPLPEEIANEEILENKIKQKYQEFSDIHKNQSDLIVSKNMVSFNKLSLASRHDVEQKLFTEKYLPVNKTTPISENKITWLENGKPEILNSNQKISISHSRSILMITTGDNYQGCDIEFVEARAEDEWVSLLGEINSNLISGLKELKENYDVSATRLWCVRESILKAFSTMPKTISVEYIHNDGVVFKGEVNNVLFHVLTFPVNIWPNNTYVIALLLASTSIEENTKVSISKETNTEITYSKHSSEVSFDNTIGQFIHNFSTTFKDCKSFYGRTYFTNYPLWMGHLRELVLAPISNNLLEDFRTGEYGMVTNTSSINIFNEAETLNSIVGKMSITDKSDFAQSFIDLEFEWFKKEGNGELVKLANSNLSTTWVKIEGHGIVKQSPIPDYFLKFLEKYTSSLSHANQNNLKYYVSQKDLGSLQYKSSAKPRPEVLLSRKIYQTGIHNGNSVGNLYYSNYYDWQAKSLEQLIYRFTPQLFTEQGRTGEYICLESKVNHLQEAMPFEEIEVAMYLEELYENGFKLYFEYFSRTGNRKLAYGHNIIAWAARKDEKSIPSASTLPKEIVSSFIEFASNNQSNSLEDNLTLIKR